MATFFSDCFDVSPEIVKDYGAFNISLINDLPLFIDPFLLSIVNRTSINVFIKTLLPI